VACSCPHLLHVVSLLLLSVMGAETGDIFLLEETSLLEGSGEGDLPLGSGVPALRPLGSGVPALRLKGPGVPALRSPGPGVPALLRRFFG